MAAGEAINSEVDQLHCVVSASMPLVRCGCAVNSHAISPVFADASILVFARAPVSVSMCVRLCFSWYLSRDAITVRPNTNIFAPANLRCANEEESYKRLILFYMEKKSATAHHIRHLTNESALSTPPLTS